MSIEIPYIITYTKILNPSLFLYYNLFLIDTLNNDNLYPFNTSTTVLNTVDKRKLFVNNVILELYACLIAISNYANDNDKNFEISKNILNKYNENYLLKSFALFNTFKDSINPHNQFIDNLRKRISEMYDNKFKDTDFVSPINAIKNNIDQLKQLNNGSDDEINICKFVMSTYKNIVDISYYLFVNEKDNRVICQKFLSRHNDLMKEFSNDYSFFGSGLDMIDMLRNNYKKTEDLPYDDVKNKILELINDKFNVLLDTVPSIYNNIDFANEYNIEIKKYLDELKNNINELNIDYYNSLNSVNSLMSSIEKVLLITYNNNNLIKIQLIYKSLYQYLLEMYDLITILSESKKKVYVNTLEGFSKKRYNCSCFVSKITLYMFFIFLIYIILKKYKFIK